MKPLICESVNLRRARTAGSRSVCSTSASRYSESTSWNRPSIAASSRRTATERGRRRRRPRITRLESTTALTAGSALTPHLPHRSVDDLVDPPLVAGTRLPPDLPDDQTELHRRGEQALDEGKLIT